MYTTATPMQRRNTPIFSILLKWTFLLLVLLASTVNTFSGELPMTKANPNRAAVPSDPACMPLGTYDLDHQNCINNPSYAKNGIFLAEAVLPPGCPTPSPNTIDVQVSPFIGTQCFYQGTCAGSYSTQVDKFCIVYIGNHTPSTDTKKCPRDGISDTIRLYNNQICFYLNTKSAACATKYILNGPDCYDIVNTGTPAGCAAPPQDILTINISRNNYTQQCFYFKQSAACSGSYSTQADQFCVGYVHGTQPTPDTASTCPKAPSDAGTIYIYGKNCFYLQTTICTDATYKLLAPSCLATNATKSAINTQCPDSTGTLSPDKSYCFVSAGTVTNCDSNTKYPYYSQGNCYYFFSASTGNQDAVNGACTNSSFPYLSKEKCYSFASTKNALKSPSGTDGMPAVNGQCPAGPSGVTVDYDTTSNICYYAISGSTCTSPYQEDSTKIWCQAPPLDTFASTKSGLPPQPCPTIDGIQYVLKSDGNCAPPGDTSTADEISPTCASGYIYDSNTKTCLANSVGALTDTSDNCKLDTAKPPQNYVCKYTTAKATLTCTIINQPSKGESNGQIECLVKTDATTGTVISHYVCDGVDTNYNPTKCYYYGNNSSRGTILAYSTCTTASSIVDCTIVTCILGGSTKLTYNEPTIFGPPAKCDTKSNDTYITATIDQSCSQFADGKPLTCTYGNSKSTKSRDVHIICSSLSDCTVYDYAYSDQYGRMCTADTPSICTITGPNNITWKESCTPYPPDQTSSSTCKIVSPTNNSTILGTFTCSALNTNPVTCTITDVSSNSMKFTCNNAKGSFPNATCTAATPECPNHTTVTESTVACSAALIVDLLATPPTTGDVTLTFPLSQAELQFLLDAKELGISSQAWTSTTQNLPKVTYV